MMRRDKVVLWVSILRHAKQCLEVIHSKQNRMPLEEMIVNLHISDAARLTHLFCSPSTLSAVSKTSVANDWSLSPTSKSFESGVPLTNVPNRSFSMSFVI